MGELCEPGDKSMSANVLEINNILNDFDEQQVVQVLEYARSLLKIKNKKENKVNEDKYKFFWEMREQLKERGLQGMTLEEINEEIASARKERKLKKKWGVDVGNWQYKTLSRESVYSNTKRNGWFNRTKQ